MALTGAAIMAALALARNQIIDQPAADRKRKYEANTAALSPWTGMKSEFVQDPNAIGAVIGGAGAGAAMGSEISKSNLMDSLAGNPAVSGATPSSPLGGDAMSANLGDRASNFQKSVPSSWTGVDANGGYKPMAANGDMAWFYGSSPSPYSQPSLSSPMSQGDPDWMSLKTPTDKYATLHKAGLSENNPQNQWQINPFKANY